MSSGAAGSSRAVPLSTSGRVYSTGSVNTEESVSPAGGVSVINSSVGVSGNLAGSVPLKNQSTGPLTLSLADAVKLGLTANLGTVTADNTSRAARAERIQALSALLPSISANASETVTQVNLAAYGFQFKLPASAGFSIPSVVGPFSYSQLQGSLSQSIFDQVQRKNFQASKETDQAAALSVKDTRELVVMAVGGAYLQALATTASVASQRVQVENANAIYQQAVTRKEAGTNSKIDVMRSLVELQTEQQRLAALEADLQKQKIVLARIIGVPLDRELILSQALSFDESTVPDAPSAIQQALKARSDLRAAEAQVHAAESALAAAHAERLPSVSLNGDYGVLGPNPASTHGVFAVTGSVNMTLWQGGRIKGDIAEAEATLHQRQAELADQQGQIEEQVRTALIELQTAKGQVKLTQNNREYANETLSEARDRFAAGVATTVEVVQAQEQVASAEESYISSLFSFDLAKLSLSRAIGNAEADLPGVLKGTQP